MDCGTMDMENIHNVLSVMQKTLECPICLDLMKEPVATRCDHMFCRFCMLQLLSKRKKSRAQCPMCKKEVTKRSLQDSPRFKLLVDGLLKIISAFELDSGCKFFPSQDYASTFTANHKEAPKKNEQSVVQSVGYRNRGRQREVIGGYCEDLLYLVETGPDTQLAKDEDTRNHRRQKRQKTETKELAKDSVLDSSEDDLLKKASTLGNDFDEPPASCEPSGSLELEEKEEGFMASKDKDQASSKLGSEDVAASDLAEYGFSEKDLESIRSNLVPVNGVRILKESTTENSEMDRFPSLSQKDFCEKVAEQRTHVKRDDSIRSTNLTVSSSNMQIEMPQYSESQSFKIAIDSEYDRDNSTPEYMGSTQGTSRERVKKSIKKVNEWFLKTDEFLNNSLSRGEELLPDVSQVDDLDVSENGSKVSEETEIMAVDHCHVVANALEKSMVSVEEKIFGRVYKREKKASVSSKVTFVADVHVDGAEEPLKVNEVPKTSSIKRKRSTGLQPEHFIKKVDGKEQSIVCIAKDSVVVDDFGLDTESNQMTVPNAAILDFDKIELVCEDIDTIDAPLSKPEKQKTSLKRNSEKAQRTRMMQSLHMTKGTDIASCQQQSPFHFSEVQIDSYSSTEPVHEVNQRNVRRSRRLYLSKENEKATDTKTKEFVCGGLQSEDPPNDIPKLINHEELCLQAAVSIVDGPQIPQITSKLPTSIAVQEMAGGGNESSPMECDSVHVTKDVCSEYSPKLDQNAADMEDSELDTQLLLKTFKSAKRMSFKLDPVTKTADKENCDPMDISDVRTNVINGQQDKDRKVKPSSLCKSNEDVHCTSQHVSVQENKPEHLRNLRSKKTYRLSLGQTENTDDLKANPTKTRSSDGQLNDISPIKDVESLEKCNQSKNDAVSKSEGLQLHSETESMSLYPVLTHQNPAASMRGDFRSGIGQGENEQAKNDSYQKCSFDEEQVNQITSSNSSQGSLTGKLLGHLASCNSSPYKSPEVYSDTPDGLLSGVNRLKEDTSCGAVAEKSFVFGDDKKSQLLDCSVSPFTQSQVVRSRKRKVQKLESSEEEESSGDEELPSLNTLFGNASSVAIPKNASASSSPQQQGGGVLAMFSSCSTSGKTQASFNLPCEALVGSQESQCSVNLFSSQSNTSDHSMNGATDRNVMHNRRRTLEGSPKRPRAGLYYTEKELANVKNEEEKDNIKSEEETMANVESADPCQEHNLGEVSGCESEASHTGDSSGLSSQCEILSTQQRDAMQNNLEKLQKEMAALEAVLEQHGSQCPVSGRERASTAERVIISPREVSEKQACNETYRSPDTIPETEVQSEQGRASEKEDIVQPPTVVGRSRSPTPPLSPPREKSKKATPEKVQASCSLHKEVKGLTDGGPMGQQEDFLHAPQPDHSAPSAINQRHSRSPKRILRNKQQEVNGHNKFRRERARPSAELKEAVQPSQHSSKQPGNTQRSLSPTFTSPLRSKAAPSFKSPVVSGKRNFSLVASGLSQSEAILVQKFARKTESVFSSQLTDSTTHVIMRTDDQLVCERTLKYFLGIAGRKWVVSYEWIVQSFREGRILDEYDFEVKGDVINGRNHRGPRRSRLGSDGLLLTDFEICCLGSFKDMTRGDLERMVSLCGACVAKNPSQFKHKPETTSLVVVQPDKETDYAAMRKKYHCIVITREWVLDSVSSYKLQAFDSYLV